jgi:hypothetical protein
MRKIFYLLMLCLAFSCNLLQGPYEYPNRHESSLQLDSLNLSQGSLSPAFNPNILDYQATVQATQIQITASCHHTQNLLLNHIPINSGAASHFIPLSVGRNHFQIKLTNQEGQTKTYQLAIDRQLTSTSSQ